MKHKKHSFALIYMILLIMVVGCASAPNVVVDALPYYDVLFSKEEGWTGGDGAYSAVLNDSEIAWFFGDTWIGQIKDGRHVNATLINNSVAIQSGRSPAGAKIDFYFGQAGDGSPAALMRPADGRGWFWIFDGVMTAKGLYLFLIQVERTAGEDVFDFKVIGGWLGHVENPAELPTAWQVRQSRIPWSKFSDSGGILWGSAVLQIDNNLYIYGTVEDAGDAGGRKHMILARAPVSALDDYSRWRFYADGNWVPEFKKASRLSDNMPHEYSVTYLPALKQYVVVYSRDGLSKDILARLSAQPQGPWSDPFRIFQCPEAAWDDSIFCYAAKAHAILSPAPDQLIITYVANSVDFGRMANDARLYRPRFLRATFSK